jgi:hypothetical protein
MAFLGRQSHREQQRIERFNAWFRARPIVAVLSPLLGLLAIVDFFTIVLGGAAGIAAIVTGVMGLKQLRAAPDRPGRPLCITGIIMGVVGLILTSLFVAFVVLK